ncbi:MAG: DUF1674 domain-containing protein [Lysobacter sp.]
MHGGRQLSFVVVMIGQTPADPASATSVESGVAATGPSDGRTGAAPADMPVAEEFGGRDGPDPTRFGDWEKNGRCIDF